MTRRVAVESREVAPQTEEPEDLGYAPNDADAAERHTHVSVP
jgi:hypothetical protein